MARQTLGTLLQFCILLLTTVSLLACGDDSSTSPGDDSSSSMDSSSAMSSSGEASSSSAMSSSVETLTPAAVSDLPATIDLGMTVAEDYSAYLILGENGIYSYLLIDDQDQTGLQQGGTFTLSGGTLSLNPVNCLRNSSMNDFCSPDLSLKFFLDNGDALMVKGSDTSSVNAANLTLSLFLLKTPDQAEGQWERSNGDTTVQLSFLPDGRYLQITNVNNSLRNAVGGIYNIQNNKLMMVNEIEYPALQEYGFLTFASPRIDGDSLFLTPPDPEAESVVYSLAVAAAPTTDSSIFDGEWTLLQDTIGWVLQFTDPAKFQVRVEDQSSTNLFRDDGELHFYGHAVFMDFREEEDQCSGSTVYMENLTGAAACPPSVVLLNAEQQGSALVWEHEWFPSGFTQ